mmetsp:Transcript_15742/g.17380  ORF Transcript_15742/g.17380 Transcript_15742/m.17380 type:complete len:750 (+) Transcript_15742:73-2322(+)
MATSSFGHAADKIPRPRPRPHPPPPPFIPSFTKKILTMVSSGNNMPITSNESTNNKGNEGDSLHHRLPPSPADSVTQAMKTDLEELIGYIDGLAFDKMERDPIAKIPSTNKQLFTTDTQFFGNSNDECDSNRNDVFRDRTNRSSVEHRQNKLRADPETSVVISPTTNTAAKIGDNISERMMSTGQRDKLLEPSGSPPTREEPVGSQPSREASLYLHDESLSLILSQSDEEIIVGSAQFKTAAATATPSIPRLLSTFQNNGIILSPKRDKKITFLPVCKDPTPSKSTQSSITTRVDGGNEIKIESRKEFGIRKGTPYLHRRVCKEQTEDNEDRNGKKDGPSIQLQTPARRAISFLPSTVDRPFTEKNGHKMMPTSTITIGDNNTHPNSFTPLHNPKFGDRDNCELKMDSTTNVIPLNRRHCIQDTDLHSTIPVIETPIPQQKNQQSNLLLTSPKSAKKLLQTAVDALKDARQEREAARQWARDIKDSVHEWVEEQRQLIRTESVLVSCKSPPPSTEILQQHHQAVEESINDLRREINLSNSSRSDTESELQMLMTNQDTQIRELSRQLTVMKEQLACIVKKGGAIRHTALGSQGGIESSSQSNNSSNKNKDEVPSTGLKTPKGNGLSFCRNASHSETSAASSHGSHRVRRSTPNGGHLVDYGNGTTKEVHPDGTTVTRYQNGDVETRFGANGSSPSSSCVVAYYHSKEEVLQITQKDGSVLYEYESGQVERHTSDGVKIVMFPDGTKTTL